MVTRISLLAASLVLCVTLGIAQGNSQGKGHGKGNPHNASDSSVNISFGTHDREIIREYYRDQYSNLPPGLAKRGGNLPPGLQKIWNAMAHCHPACRNVSRPSPWNWSGDCRRFPPAAAAAAC